MLTINILFYKKEKLKQPLKEKVYVNCRLNISEATFKSIEKIIEDFSDLSLEEKMYIRFSFHKVWQEKINLHSQILELIELFKSNNFLTQYNMYTDTVRGSCYADKKYQATINYNGDVFKCTARDFTTENREGILLEDGTIDWNDKYYNRVNAKFNNPPCLACKILPICNGSCSQKALDNKGVDYCIHGFNENRKNEIIRAKLEHILN